MQKKLEKKLEFQEGVGVILLIFILIQKNLYQSNPSFIISALNQYTYQNFIDLMNKHRIKFHEKKLGQLFCDESAQQIIDMLKFECLQANVILKR